MSARRIWAWPAGSVVKDTGTWLSREPTGIANSTEYVRADLHAAAVAELRRLLDCVGEHDRRSIEGALIDAGEAV